MVKVPVVSQPAYRQARGGPFNGKGVEGEGGGRCFGQDITNTFNQPRKELLKPEKAQANLKRPTHGRKATAMHAADGPAKRTRVKSSVSAAAISSRTRSRRMTGSVKGKIIQSRVITRKAERAKARESPVQNQAWISGNPTSGIESRSQSHFEILADKKNSNLPQAVSAYHGEITEFLRLAEPEIRPVKLKGHSKWRLSGQMVANSSSNGEDYYDRTALADWMAKVCREFGLKDETLIIALNVLDRCIGSATAAVKELDPLLLAIGSMRIASKYEEILVNHIDDYLKLVQHEFSRKDVISAEYAILENIDFRIVQPCHLTVAERIRTLLRIKEEDHQNVVVSQTSVFLIKLALVYGQSTAIHGDQFVLASAAALLVAEKVYGANASCLQKICEVLAVDMEQLSLMVAQLLVLTKASARQQPSNPVRRSYLHRIGIGSGTAAEGQLLK